MQKPKIDKNKKIKEEILNKEYVDLTLEED